MITTLDITSILFNLIYIDEVKIAVSGDIYKDVRPTYSKESSPKEDVVVGTLPVSIDTIQKATCNVNIHVPDVVPGIGAIQQYQPNFLRLKTLTAIILPLVEGVYADDYSFCLVNQSILKEENTNEHYVNLRLEFTYHNY